MKVLDDHQSGSEVSVATCPAGPAFHDDELFRNNNYALVDALRSMVFDGRYEQIEAPVREAVIELRASVNSGLTHAQRSRNGYEQLRELAVRLGPARKVAADPQLLFALFDWAGIMASDLVPVLSGHFTLTVGAIQRLGDGTPWQQRQLDLLDDAGHVGVFLLTELGYGSNVLEMETEAVWDQGSRCFRLTTPNGAACKFMPNVGANGVPKLTIIAARLKADGKDEGIFPFIVPLRDETGTMKGVDVVALPDKGFAPMDNAMIRFHDVRLPYEAWLPGGTAHIDDDGRIVCSVPARERFLRTIEQLQAGRIALSSGAVASSRAALWLTTRYAERRRTAGGVTMLQRDNVQRSLASCAARVFATTALANAVRRHFTDPATPPEMTALLAMLAKPLLSSTAMGVLQECRERCGAQGMFRVNHIPDYIGNVQGVITAEGENQVLQVAAGRLLKRLSTPQSFFSPSVVDNLDRSSWWRELLIERERALALTLAPINGSAPTTTAIGPSSAAIDLAVATADRLAVDAMSAAAQQAAPQAREIAYLLAEVYALERIRGAATWYIAQELLNTDRAAEVERRLALGYREIAEHLPALVDAFAIPDLGAPIAGDYITAWLDYAGWNGEHGAARGRGGLTAAFLRRRRQARPTRSLTRSRTGSENGNGNGTRPVTPPPAPAPARMKAPPC